MFYRAVSFLRLNIQLLFVFDGPHRPWKRGGRGGSRVDYEQTSLLAWMFDTLGIPTLRAPGEAEAECSQLQREGVVDAVLSEDGDALMFGATLLFRTYYEKGKKSTTHVRVYRAAEILSRHRLDQKGMICFAMLAGGDYSKGLRGCGPVKALRAAQCGLGDSLCQYPDSELRIIWRLELREFLQGSVEVPSDFPDPKILKKYRDPRVCAPEQRHELRFSLRGWGDRPIDERKLRSLLRLYFNIQTKAYIKHILPLLLVRTLSQTLSGQEASNKAYDIKIVNARKHTKDGSANESSYERKITFDPKFVTSLDLSVQPDGEEGEDWSQFATKSNEPFDPMVPVQCEILECVLQRGAPYVLVATADEPRAQKSKKTGSRKRAAGKDDTELVRKRAKKHNTGDGDCSAGSPANENPSGSQQERATSTDRSRQQGPARIQSENTNIVDLTLDSESESDGDALVTAALGSAHARTSAYSSPLSSSFQLGTADKDSTKSVIPDASVRLARVASPSGYETVDLT